MPRTKISSKNKNVINIKINTEKKAKNNRRKRTNQSSSPKGKSSYNSGYSVMPPIIIQPAAPNMMFPQYNQPEQINHTIREPQPIHTIAQQPQPVHHIASVPQPVNISPAPEPQLFINPTNTTPVPIMQTIKTKSRKHTEEKDDEFINPPSTHQVSFAKAINDEKNDDYDWFSSPLNLKEKFKPTPNLDTIHKYYSDYETDNENLKTNPKYPAISSIKDTKIYPSTGTMNGEEKQTKKKEHSNVVNATYHSIVDNFDRKNEEHKKKYGDLLEQYNQLVNPGGKPDADFHGKPPSKERFKKLQTRVKNYYKKLEKQSDDEVRPIARKKPTPKKGQISPEY